MFLLPIKVCVLSVIFCGIASAASSVQELVAAYGRFTETLDVAAYEVLIRDEVNDEDLAKAQLYRSTGHIGDDGKRVPAQKAEYYTYSKTGMGFFIVGDKTSGMAFFPDLGIKVQAYDRRIVKDLSRLFSTVDINNLEAIIGMCRSARLVQPDILGPEMAIDSAVRGIEFDFDIKKLTEMNVVPRGMPPLQMLVFFNGEPDVVMVLIYASKRLVSQARITRVRKNGQS